MSRQQKQLNITTSLIKLSGDGLKVAKLNSKQLKGVIEDTSSTTKQRKIIKSSIVECPLPNKKKICNVKSPSYKKSTQIINSSQTLAAESTSNEKTFSPFYNKSSMETFQKLWFPLTIDSQDAEVTSLSGYYSGSGANSFLYKKKLTNHPNKNYPKTCYQSLQSLQPDTMGLEGTQIRSRKIRVYPTQKQKLYFNKWKCA